MKNFERILKNALKLSEEKYKATAIIVAAGQSSRMKLEDGKSKLTLEICGKTVLERTVKVFDSCDYIDSIVIVCREADKEYISSLAEDKKFSKVTNIVSGGTSRQESVLNAIETLPKDTKFIAIHDGARCLIKDEDIKNIIVKAYITGAATAGHKVSDTLKKCGENGVILETIPRENVYSVQTPQAFLLDLYKCGLAAVKKKNLQVTDDNAIAECADFKVSIVETSKENIKITTAEDITIAENIIKSRERK